VPDVLGCSGVNDVFGDVLRVITPRVQSSAKLRSGSGSRVAGHQSEPDVNDTKAKASGFGNASALPATVRSSLMTNSPQGNRQPIRATL